ncbi:hypothetical protein NT6N_24360 [Oceaniferula spumae]|uniref:Uncharacterized protein n=1 Tax=Oceaniferula spumae TaxID=2979115 RepID=A0AAT9FNA5_9BACT
MVAVLDFAPQLQGQDSSVDSRDMSLPLLCWAMFYTNGTRLALQPTDTEVLLVAEFRSPVNL